MGFGDKGRWASEELSERGTAETFCWPASIYIAARWHNKCIYHIAYSVMHAHTDTCTHTHRHTVNMDAVQVQDTPYSNLQ